MMPAQNNELGKTLRNLLTGIAEISVKDDCLVNGLSLDSNTIEAGEIFFALSGHRVHGLSYASDAIDRGACAVLWDAESGQDDVVMLDNIAKDIPLIPIVNLKQKIGTITERFLNQPSMQLFMIGVTGTNGKTSCSHFIARALMHDDKSCVVGTLGNGFVNQLQETRHTTPDAISLHHLLADYLQQGAKNIVMEVSSHGLIQGRVSGIDFDMAIFTNLSREHLDYHGDMENYGNAKKLLFTNPDLKTVIVNVDDSFGRDIAELVQDSVKVIRYGIEANRDVDVRASKIKTDSSGIHFDVITPWGSGIVSSKMLGRFNVSNLLAVVSALLAKGVRFEDAISRISHLASVPGRMELIDGDSGSGEKNAATFIVDYAHTPDALAKVLQSLRDHIKPSSDAKLWCVFGCGGDRDQGKRSEMGELAEEFSDHVIVTDDNPRTEAASYIVAQILEGALKQHDIVVIHDRNAAIKYAMDNAAKQDVVLVAGKGHEAYQVIGQERLPYVGDAQVIRSLLTDR